MSESTHTYLAVSVPGYVELGRRLPEGHIKRSFLEDFDSFKFTGYGCGHSGRLVAGYAFEGRTADGRKYVTQAGPFVGDMLRRPCRSRRIIVARSKGRGSPTT